MDGTGLGAAPARYVQAELRKILGSKGLGQGYRAGDYIPAMARLPGPAAALLLLWTAAVMACSTGTEAGGERTSVLLANDDSASVYLLSQTEVPGPSSQVQPGRTRTISLDYQPGNPLGAPFHAIRGAQRLDQVFCYARETGPAMAPEVRWNGSRLTCHHWGT